MFGGLGALAYAATAGRLAPAIDCCYCLLPKVLPILSHRSSMPAKGVRQRPGLGRSGAAVFAGVRAYLVTRCTDGRRWRMDDDTYNPWLYVDGSINSLWPLQFVQLDEFRSVYVYRTWARPPALPVHRGAPPGAPARAGLPRLGTMPRARRQRPAGARGAPRGRGD